MVFDFFSVPSSCLCARVAVLMLAVFSVSLRRLVFYITTIRRSSLCVFVCGGLSDYIPLEFSSILFLFVVLQLHAERCGGKSQPAIQIVIFSVSLPFRSRGTRLFKLYTRHAFRLDAGICIYLCVCIACSLYGILAMKGFVV